MSRSDRTLVAAIGGALVLVVAAAAALFVPGQAEPTIAGDEAALVLESAAPSSTPDGDLVPIVVDVEGAVAAPGIRELAAGSRIADAIAAAGGYAPDADLDAAATTINLAQRLVDGQQIVVPKLGAATAAASPGTSAGGSAASGGMVDLNTASAEELEALPGIGAVTVEKIIAARRERPFASLQDAVERGVIHNGQLQDIEGLATAG